MKNKFSIAMSLAVIMTMLLTSLALAENVKNDVVAGGNGTITEGGSTTINYWIQDTGQPGSCEASDGSPVTLRINVPGNVTVDTDAALSGNQNLLTFGACSTSSGSPNNTKPVIFSSSVSGSYGITVSYVSDAADPSTEYNTSPASFTLTVTSGAIVKTTPEITWAAPADIVYGTALSGTQLNATASVPGTFAYTPAAGTVLNAGAGQILHVDFTPTDTTNYNSASKDVMINVSQADALVTVNGYTGDYDGAAHGATGTATGVGGADLSAGLDLGASFTNVPGGTANWTFEGGTNYLDESGSVSINITKASSTTVVSFEAGPYVYRGTAFTATAAVTGVNLSQSAAVAYSGDCTNVTAANGCTATATFAGDQNHTGSGDSKSITITKANATIVVNGYSGVYDASAHGATGSATGVLGEDLGAGLSLGNSFTNVPGGSANWTFTGGTNYNDASGSVAIDISKADATIVVNGYTGVYDAAAHGATGSATGVGGVDLSSGLNLGSSFTNVPGGIANWIFTGGTNYNDANGTANIEITKADATCSISGYSGLFDGAAHGASGSCSGIGGESAGTLNLGASFTYPLGGTANWTFTGNGNYNNQNGSVAINIAAWTYGGFYQPVDMGNVWNTVKGGSTVPLKFNVYAGGVERTDVAAIESYAAKVITCTSLPGAVEDVVETLSATGGTSLRYDTTGHQFIFNWQTPKAASTCYQVTVTLLDHSKITAFFKLK